MEIIDTFWFTNPGGLIGITLCKTEEGDLKSYIGCIKEPSTPEKDSEWIMKWGNPFPVEVAKHLMEYNI